MPRHVIIFLLLSVCPAVFAADHAHDEAAIRSQIAAYAAARQTGNGGAQAEFYTEDADEWPSAAREMVQGRAAVAKALNFAPKQGLVVAFKPIKIAFVKEDVALVDSLYGSPQPVGHAFYVMLKQDGKWLIRSARITRFPAPAAK
jgi:ketosteroid isomerase-like protein